MRKQALHTTALAAAAMLIAGGALAADKKMEKMKPSIAVGGFYNVIVGGFLDETSETSSPSGNMNTEKSTSALDVRHNGEVWFSGSATLDNGLKIATRVELEGQNHGTHEEGAGSGASADPIDHYSLSISGAFGQIVLGGTPGVPATMIGGYSGTGTGVGAHLHFDNWVGNAGKANTYITVADNDTEKVSYISPSFGGFQVGMSYSPEGNEATGNNRPDADGAVHDGLSGAARYSGTFGDVGFGIGASMETYQGANEDAAVSDQRRWSVGAYLDFGGGIRVAAAHMRNEDDNNAANGQTTDAGVRYVVGSNRFSLMGVYAELDDSEDTRTTVIGSYGRAVGAGVTAHADLVWSESQGDKDAEGAQKKSNGLVMLTGIKVKF